MNTIVLTQEQLDHLVEVKVLDLLTELGQIPTHISARSAWKLCGGRSRFEKLCELGYIKPVRLAGYKTLRYLRSDVVRAVKGVRPSNNSKKIRL